LQFASQQRRAFPKETPLQKLHFYLINWIIFGKISVIIFVFFSSKKILLQKLHIYLNDYIIFG